MNSVLVDTSFLISLSKPTLSHHHAAKQCYRECIHRQVPMLLSTIVIAEFQVRQPIDDLPLRNFLVMPFNIDHAMACGLLIRASPRDAGDDRVRIKDDFKLIAQCVCEGVSHLLSEDASTLAKYLSRLGEQGSANTKVVLLQSGFDASWFEGGQSRLMP